MVSQAQMRQAHAIASMGLVPYARLVEAMDKRSASVALYAELRQVFDQPAGERTLLEAYRFARRSAEWTGMTFAKAFWIWLRRHSSPAALQQYTDLVAALRDAAQQRSLDLEHETQRLNHDADRYLIERITVCLKGDPFAEEWRSEQIEAHQIYDFWWAQRSEGTAQRSDALWAAQVVEQVQIWKQEHPFPSTERLWKVVGARTATPMICLPGTREETLASTKRAFAALERWDAPLGRGTRRWASERSSPTPRRGYRRARSVFCCAGRLTGGDILARIEQERAVAIPWSDRRQVCVKPLKGRCGESPRKGTRRIVCCRCGYVYLLCKRV
ncbi:hypothetical protein [Ktedonobacter racemifer]|nr:hypothetical protein [Ktedonobacter racemifer]